MPADRSADLHHYAVLIRQHIAGEVLTDAASCRDCARDASPYFSMPAAVLRPRDRDDVIAIVQLAAEHGVPLIARAAGTSLAGQCVGEGVVVDMGAHQNLILDFDPGIRRITVQPGTVRGVLNRHLAPHDLMFAPDPSTTDRCQIGGMVGNNAWGLHALRDGTTREHVVALEAVLADGTTVTLKGVNAAALKEQCRQAGREGDLYRGVTAIMDRHGTAIAAAYPSMRGIPNNAGYALDTLLRGQPWNNDGPRFNLAPLLCGAEGTLALVTAVTLKLNERPRAERLLCLHFDSVEAALAAVAAARAMQPSALELLDRAILRVAARHAEQQANRFWLQGDPGAVLLMEFSGGSAETVMSDSERARAEFAVHACTTVEGAAVERVWSPRRAALSMLMESETGFHAVTGIEDAAVAPADLPAFYQEVKVLLDALGLPFFVYGPVGMGALHVRPELRLDTAAGISIYEQLLDAVAAIVVRYRGSFSCKHGDGRLRGKYLAGVLGEEVVAALRAVKQTFDPAGILNPGKILDCPPVTADLALPSLH